MGMLELISGKPGAEQKEIQDNLKELRVLTDQVRPILANLVNNGRRGESIRYDTNGGTCVGLWLDGNPDETWSVQKAFMSCGAEFPPHKHVGSECLIVLSGKLAVTINGNPDPTHVSAGSCISFRPGEGHSVTALEDTWMIGSIVPGEEGYPSAGS